jgi:hypothetical protein
MPLPSPVQRTLIAIWRFPAKGIVVLLLAVILFEGDAPRDGKLPTGCLIAISAAFALLFFDRGWPIKFCTALVIISLAARENYPLSHYPMYDRFTDHTFYVYIADKDGEPIPVQSLTGIRTSRIKKPYDKALNVVRKRLDKRKRELTPEESREAGMAALLKLYEDSPPAGQTKLEALSPLRLYEVDIYARNGAIEKEAPDLIAELELPPR